MIEEDEYGSFSEEDYETEYRYTHGMNSVTEEEELQLLEEMFNLTVCDKDLDFPQ